MSFKIILKIVVFYLVALEIDAENVFRIKSEFCNITDVYVVCRGVDPGGRNYSTIEYAFNPAWSVSIVDSPHLSVVPKKFVAAYELRLSNTQVEHLSADDFLYGGVVKKLDFSSNKIRNLSSDALVNIPFLMYLNLSSNQLETLPADLFLNSTMLVEVDIGGNRLSNLDPNLFSGRSIVFLDVSFNNLSNNLGFLQKMPNLTTLNLSGNCVQHLVPSLFVKNHQLQDLSLSQACIRTIEYGAFPYNNLTELDLSYNPMKDIDYGAFITITNLEKLLLKGSHVDVAGIRFIISILNLREIELESDFYHCRVLVQIVNELRKKNTKLLVSVPYYETSNISGLKCKDFF